MAGVLLFLLGIVLGGLVSPWFFLLCLPVIFATLTLEDY